MENDIDTAGVEYFFNPRSIAVLGASTNFEKPGGRPIWALKKKGYAGKIYPVNPRYDKIDGLPCYPLIAAIPGEVDMAIISVPVELTMDILEECADKKVKVAVVFTSGFAEVGPEGKALQKRMRDLAAERGIRILGPNCLGLVYFKNRVMASFTDIVDLEPVHPLSLGFVTQSGAYGEKMYIKAAKEGIAHRNGRRPRGRNVGILTGSGGEGVVLADKCESFGLVVPEFTGETRKKLVSYLPFFGSARNPVDMTAAVATDLSIYRKCLQAMLDDERIDMVIAPVFFLAPYASIIHDTLEVYRSTTKPLVLSPVWSDESPAARELIELVKEANIPMLSEEVDAAQALANLTWYGEKFRQATAGEVGEAAVPTGSWEELLKSPEVLTEGECKEVLKGFGIAVTREGLAASAREAVALARQIGYPVVREIKGFRVLEGMRGRPPADLGALEEVILKVSRLIELWGERIRELDINPLVVFPRGAKVVDALIVKKVEDF